MKFTLSQEAIAAFDSEERARWNALSDKFLAAQGSYRYYELRAAEEYATASNVTVYVVEHPAEMSFNDRATKIIPPPKFSRVSTYQEALNLFPGRNQPIWKIEPGQSHGVQSSSQQPIPEEA